MKRVECDGVGDNGGFFECDAARRHGHLDMPGTDLWVVCWKYKGGGASGHGQPVGKNVAQSAIDEMNEKYPGIKHWMIQA